MSKTDTHDDAPVAVSKTVAEAVEAAIKLARHATKKQNIIAMQGSYHGRTFGEL